MRFSNCDAERCKTGLSFVLPLSLPIPSPFPSKFCLPTLLSLGLVDQRMDAFSADWHLGSVKFGLCRRGLSHGHSGCDSLSDDRVLRLVGGEIEIEKFEKKVRNYSKIKKKAIESISSIFPRSSLS